MSVVGIGFFREIRFVSSNSPKISIFFVDSRTNETYCKPHDYEGRNSNRRKPNAQYNITNHNKPHWSNSIHICSVYLSMVDKNNGKQNSTYEVWYKKFYIFYVTDWIFTFRQYRERSVRFIVPFLVILYSPS